MMGNQDGTLVDEWIDDEEGRRARRWRREKWRRLWIAKFAARQRAARNWIAVADLADWCAHSTTTASIEAEAQAREVAYRRLTDSILKSELERDGRSKVLYLDTLVTSDGASPRCRLTREQFEIALDAVVAPPASSLPIMVLNCCWLPADLAREWLEVHGYRWSPGFDPVANKEGAEAARPAGDKPPRRPPSREKPFWPEAHAVVFEWLEENGCPAVGDGQQAELERFLADWLQNHARDASESAVRRHVRQCLNNRREELNYQGS